MIALGGTIGTGLFVGSGQTLALGGPAFTLVSYPRLFHCDRDYGSGHLFARPW